MTDKAELLEQRRDYKGRIIVIARTGPNRAERRRNKALAKKKRKRGEQ